MKVICQERLVDMSSNFAQISEFGGVRGVNCSVIVDAVVALACIIIRGVSALPVYSNRDNKLSTSMKIRPAKHHQKSSLTKNLH